MQDYYYELVLQHFLQFCKKNRLKNSNLKFIVERFFRLTVDRSGP